MANKKRPYSYAEECKVVEWAIANDVFIHDALEELFETMERSDRETAVQKQLGAIPFNPEAKSNPGAFPELTQRQINAIKSEVNENPENFPELKGE